MNERKVAWWRFWNPRSGVIGGMLYAIMLFMGINALVLGFKALFY